MKSKREVSKSDLTKKKKADVGRRVSHIDTLQGWERRTLDTKPVCGKEPVSSHYLQVSV